jgi:hypothetical protein
VRGEPAGPEEAGFGLIVASKTSSAADDLADRFKRHGNYFTDGQTIETTRAMGTGSHARDRRVVYQHSFKRSQNDSRAINKMIERAEAVAAGHPAAEEGPVRQDHRRHQGCGLEAGGTRPLLGRAEGLCH